MTNEATQRQQTASRPDQSTWLSANAGSGKTRVLTNRVARLLLQGADPQNILCLTYTKAAASEMQNRLFKTLGEWAMLDDTRLRKELATLGEDNVTSLDRARTLFARAIDTPGGLKIQTIHSFCGSILRQFPVEAGVTPQFRELDEQGQTVLIDEILEDIAVTNPDVITNLVAYVDEGSLAGFVKNLIRDYDHFGTRDRAEIYSLFDISTDLTQQDIVDQALGDGEIAFLKSIAKVIHACAIKPTDKKFVELIGSMPIDRTPAVLEQLEKLLLVSSGENAFSPATRMLTNDVKNNADVSPLMPEFVSIQEKIAIARAKRVALAAAEKTWCFHSFAEVFLPAYTTAKQDIGALDFDDLIRNTSTLLSSRDLQWVLYRLDARIDHILVDEAQDTSPRQWDLIESLTDEFSSGETDRPRTLFVVGDKKQSIYSFQGADAAVFDHVAHKLHTRMEAGPKLHLRDLTHSFRSAPAILSVVDKVFQTSDASADHIAFHQDMPGRVDLWPLIERTENQPEAPWYLPTDRPVENAPSRQLADQLAKFIKDTIETGTITGDKGPRKVQAGDFMILVQKRSPLFHQIIQACKKLELPIAGSDRLRLGSELAVRDLLAFLSFLALPEDNLSLATILKSPLFGWSEQDLYTLANARGPKEYLWQALRSDPDTYPETLKTLSELRDRVDYHRPYELLETILTRYSGRERLLARLGPEAEDGINVLLAQALAYERDAVPSLTGFLEFAKVSDAEIKRQADVTGNLIRVMTVHGAKGLESPIVILPDTTSRPGQQDKSITHMADGFPIASVANQASTPVVDAAKEAKAKANEQERDRLLYVAMTRAEKWLIVCGVKPGQNSTKLNWHHRVEEGLGQTAAQPLETGAGDGFRYETGQWPTAQGGTADAPDHTADSLQSFANAPAEGTPDPVASPSQLGGAHAIGGAGQDEAAAQRKGRQIHLLLEHLPHAKDPETLAQRLLAHGSDAAEAQEIPDLLREAQNVITNHPTIFHEDALAEVDVSSALPTKGGIAVSGTIDRLLVSDDRVLAVDFKSNAAVPDRAEDTPEGFLRQLGAYLEALEPIFPDRKIDVAILWTANADLMVLEHGIVREALARATIS